LEASWAEETSGICPECLLTIPATLYADDGHIWMRGICVWHGESTALLASDAEEYLRLRTFVPPRMGEGCCGPGVQCDSGPTVCVLLLEITDACNLRCPTCYADARGHDFMTLEEARRRMDSFFRFQNRLDILMLSGGEPTIHPEFEKVLDLALSYPIQRVVINTNGLRLNQSKELVRILQERRQQIELYFSFSGFSPEVHKRLYGVDLRKQKLAALECAHQAGILVTLVPTVPVVGVKVEMMGTDEALTVVDCDPVLLAVFGSGWVAETLAELVIVPPAVGVTTMEA